VTKTHGGEVNVNTRFVYSLLASVVVGVVITLLSGFIQTPMGHLGVDVVYWGIPLTWRMWVIPTHFQSIDWLNLIVDLSFWVSITAIASTSLMYLGRRSVNRRP
jgi:hypothetical protein